MCTHRDLIIAARLDFLSKPARSQIVPTCFGPPIVKQQRMSEGSALGLDVLGIYAVGMDTIQNFSENWLKRAKD